MVLKGRLRLIYDMIPPCDILADIGTDHALIPAYALMNGRCKRAIACDVRTGPLERARRTVAQYFLGDRMELRLGSGLEPIREEEADCIVMAGMGGILIAELIEESLKKAQLAKSILLQPMVGQEMIRPFLWSKGFEISDEALTREGDKLYQVLSVRYTGRIRESWDQLDEVIGEKLVEKHDPLLTDWVRDRIKRQRKIVNGLLTAKTPGDTVQRENDLLNSLNELLKSLEG